MAARLRDRTGVSVETLPADLTQKADLLRVKVDTALLGLDRGEVVTIPSLPDAADWEAFTAARLHLHPNLSRDHAAARYQAAA